MICPPVSDLVWLAHWWFYASSLESLVPISWMDMNHASHMWLCCLMQSWRWPTKVVSVFTSASEGISAYACPICMPLLIALVTGCSFTGTAADLTGYKFWCRHSGGKVKWISICWIHNWLFLKMLLSYYIYCLPVEILYTGLLSCCSWWEQFSAWWTSISNL